MNTATYHPITKEKVRGYVVIACKVKGAKCKDSKMKDMISYERGSQHNSYYPYLSIGEAIDIMNTLEARGFDTVAYTKANDIEENLTLEQLKELNLV